MPDLLLAGGSVVDGTGAEPREADLGVSGGRIVPVDALAGDAETIDCGGRFVMPGFIDTHCHLDGRILSSDAQLAVLRQGVTTVIVGQDGVSYAPGDGGYATSYFSSINGSHPGLQGTTVADLLASYDGATAVNVGYLVPQGTVRHEVMGMAERVPTPGELDEMVALVEQGMRDGALGISTGLDYVPGRFADTDELVALCRPVREHGGLYASHLRGYRESGVAEAARISVQGGLPVHISHYHGPTAELVGWLDDGRRAGADLTFDAYPYDRGCTNLSLLVLPPAMQALTVEEIVAQLCEPSTVAYFASTWLPERGAGLGLGDDWLDLVEFTYIGDSDLAWAEGMSISAAARRLGVGEAEFIARVMRAARLEVGATVPFGNSGEAEAEELAMHEGYMCGSDGIYLGSQPHPRGWGSFARVLARYVRGSGSLSWGRAAWKLSGHPAARFALPDRGRVAEGAIADLAVVDPAKVRDTADYGSGRSLAEGVGDVLVAGVPVLRHGELTGATPGTGVRRGRRSV